MSGAPADGGARPEAGRKPRLEAGASSAAHRPATPTPGHLSFVRSHLLPIAAALVVLAGGGAAGWLSHHSLVIAIAAGSALAGLWSQWPRESHSGMRSLAHKLIDNPDLLSAQRRRIIEELDILEDAQELQRGVFEVSAELVGCVEEADARNRFAAAMRRYWNCAAVDLMIWERGAWRSLGAPASGEPPVLDHPVQLPEENNGDLVLDLSPGVVGQAVLTLRHAGIQPSLVGRSASDQRYVAEVLRGQFALSLRRVTLYGDLQALARQDPLTGTHRRWYGEHRLAELVDAGEVVSVAMVDIDHFKRVNDEHGHAAGDQVLAAVGRALGQQLRTGDLVCRYGGEEFLVILPDTSPAGAEQVAGRLRSAVAVLADLPCAMTVSIGVAACHQDESPAELVERADRALYEAKNTGRNRVALAENSIGMTTQVRITGRKRRSTETSL